MAFKCSQAGSITANRSRPQPIKRDLITHHPQPNLEIAKPQGISVLEPSEVRGAKVRADLVPTHTVPQSDAKKWRNSVPFVRIPSVCCTCVPGLLPLLPSEGCLLYPSPLFQPAFQPAAT